MNEKPESIPEKHIKKQLIVVVSVIVLIIGLGVYLLKQNQVNDLQSQVKTLENRQTTKSQAESAVVPSNDDPTTFTYSPKTGGLTFVYDKKYVVIENVDGNKGGAGGARFKVGTKKADNYVIDHSYYGTQIDVDEGNSSLESAVQAAVARLKESDSNRKVTVEDATVAGLPAKKISAAQLGYEGYVTVFVTISGDYKYTVRVHGEGDDNQQAMQNDILNGISIKEVKL